MKLPLVAGNTMRLNLTGAGLVLLCLTLTSCGMFSKKDKPPQYYAATSAPTLEIPEGFSRPASPGALIIPVPLAPLPKREMRAVPPRVNSQAGSDANGSAVKWSAGGVYLLVPDTQASVFRRLGIALTRSGMSLMDTTSDTGYIFDYRYSSKDPNEGFFSKMAFWRDDAPNYSGAYEAVIQADGEKTRVYIKNSDGSEADPDASEHLLDVLGERLG